MRRISELWLVYRLHLRRRRFLLRAVRKSFELELIVKRTHTIKPGDVLTFSTVRNEIIRLPYFLEHHRKLGVHHFLFVDNASDDGTSEFLAKQPDVSLWHTSESYRHSRFGLDWLMWLQIKYAHHHWCLTLDADELFIYPDWEKQSLSDLTKWLDAHNIPIMAALMIDLYPDGCLSQISYQPGTDPIQILNWFDPDNYTWEKQSKFRNISIRGGVRKRYFFADAPEHAPHLHKIPLIKWRRSYAYASSTHLVLPRRLNNGFDARLNFPTGALLHTKFLDIALEKSREEKIRGEHFTYADRYEKYYDQIIADPDLWTEQSMRYEGWRQLQNIGLINGGNWSLL